jgi:hypothetical protein
VTIQLGTSYPVSTIAAETSGTAAAGLAAGIHHPDAIHPAGSTPGRG